MTEDQKSDINRTLTVKGVRKRGAGVKTPPLSLIFYKNFITCAKVI